MTCKDAGVLILGGTSLIGRFLLPLLSQAGSVPRALTRAEQPDAAPDVANVRWVVGDLTRPQSLVVLGQAQQVFSLSPIWLLPEALPVLRDLGARRIVAFSSTSRFTKAQSTAPTERAVAARLAEGEARTIAFCQAHGIGWTLLRPTLIYAEGRDGNVSRLAALIRRLGFLPMAGAGTGLRQPVHAADLARGTLAAMDSDLAINRAYDLPGGETLTYRAMTERVFLGLGRRPRILTLPPFLFQAALTLARPLLPGATVQMGARIGEDLIFDPAPAHRDFGWTPRDFHPDFRETYSS